MIEDSDNTEREFKFARSANDEVILGLLRPLLTSQKLVKWPPRTVLDVYFDTEDLALAAKNATIRFRKRKKNIGWTVNFKPPPASESGYLSRREIRTSITVDEATAYRRELVGNGAELAYELIGGRRRGALMPIVHTVSNRRCYTVKNGELEDPASNFLNVILEEVTAIDVRGVDLRPLLRSGFLDYRTPLREARFAHDEIEADGRSDNAVGASIQMMLQLGQRVREAGLGVVQVSKYQTSLRLLDIRPQ